MWVVSRLQTKQCWVKQAQDKCDSYPGRGKIGLEEPLMTSGQPGALDQGEFQARVAGRSPPSSTLAEQSLWGTRLAPVGTGGCTLSANGILGLALPWTGQLANSRSMLLTVLQFGEGPLSGSQLELSCCEGSFLGPFYPWVHQPHDLVPPKGSTSQDHHTRGWGFNMRFKGGYEQFTAGSKTHEL